MLLAGGDKPSHSLLDPLTCGAGDFKIFDWSLEEMLDIKL